MDYPLGGAVAFWLIIGFIIGLAVYVGFSFLINLYDKRSGLSRPWPWPGGPFGNLVVGPVLGVGLGMLVGLGAYNLSSDRSPSQQQAAPSDAPIPTPSDAIPTQPQGGDNPVRYLGPLNIDGYCKNMGGTGAFLNSSLQSEEPTQSPDKPIESPGSTSSSNPAQIPSFTQNPNPTVSPSPTENPSLTQSPGPVPNPSSIPSQTQSVEPNKGPPATIYDWKCSGVEEPIVVFGDGELTMEGVCAYTYPNQPGYEVKYRDENDPNSLECWTKP